MSGNSRRRSFAAKGAKSLARVLLLPFAWIYAMAAWLRNLLYDKRVLNSRAFVVPSVCVGNITAGGTGKTPHVEYLIGLLSGVCGIGVASRGYGRRTKGLVLAGPQATAAEIGDEPFQIKKKFPAVQVAVSERRELAIERLLAPDVSPPVGAVLLDDAFQHRSVAAGLNILLIDYSRPVHKDLLLPAGRLREPCGGIARADMIIVTKCPPRLTEEESERFIGKCLALRSMRLVFRGRRPALRRKSLARPAGGVYFSTMSYSAPFKVFGGGAATLPGIGAKYARVVVLAAVARPEPFVEEVRRFCNVSEVMLFPDHHAFTPADLSRMEKAVGSGCAAVITTEKDAARLMSCTPPVSPLLRGLLYALPVKAEFLFGGGASFNGKVTGYVRHSQGNG